MIHRLILLVSLLGMVLALHLWVQKARNFDQGCWGAGQVAVATAEGCQSPALEKVDSLFGVSTAAWGYLFYLAVASLAFAKVFLRDAAARKAHAASEILVLLAFPYACFLVVYQLFIAHAICPLCMVSSGLIALLFIVHLVCYLRGGYEPISDAERTIEIGYASGVSFMALGLLAGVLVIVNQVGTRSLAEGAGREEFIALLGQTLPTYIDREHLQAMKPARLDFSTAPIQPEEWIHPDTPVLGNPEGVKVIAFLDPNCPGCRHEFATLRSLADRYGDQAAFYVIPRVLWDYSLLQSQALFLAGQEDRYFDMWQLQFDRAKQGGMDLNDLEPLFAELGMNVEQLSPRLATHREKVMALRRQAMEAGINSTPNGVAVDSRSRDEASLAKLIERAAARRDKE